MMKLLPAFFVALSVIGVIAETEQLSKVGNSRFEEKSQSSLSAVTEKVDVKASDETDLWDTSRELQRNRNRKRNRNRNKRGRNKRKRKNSGRNKKRGKNKNNNRRPKNKNNNKRPKNKNSGGNKNKNKRGGGGSGLFNSRRTYNGRNGFFDARNDVCLKKSDGECPCYPEDDDGYCNGGWYPWRMLSENRGNDSKYEKCDSSRVPKCGAGQKLCPMRKPRLDRFIDRGSQDMYYYIDYDCIQCVPVDENCSMCSPGLFCHCLGRCVGPRLVGWCKRQCPSFYPNFGKGN